MIPKPVPHSRRLLPGVFLLLCTLFLLLQPEHTSLAVRDAISLCTNVLIPALFPFFILSSLIVELGLYLPLAQLLRPIMSPLFRLNGNCACAFLLGIIGGYPVGARTALHLYQSGQCSKSEAERMLAFCNNCGPAFILGAVGSGILSSHRAGILLYVSHLFASILIGSLFRFYKSDSVPLLSTDNTAAVPPHFVSAVAHCIPQAAYAMLNTASFVLAFSVLLSILTCSGVLPFFRNLFALTPFGVDPQLIKSLLHGLLELSSGITLLDQGSWPARLTLAAFLLGWGGLSIHFQVISLFSDTPISLRPYLIGKLLHGLLSATLVRIFLHACPLSAPALAVLSEAPPLAAQIHFQQVLAVSVFSAWAVWLAFLFFAAQISKKRCGNARFHQV